MNAPNGQGALKTSLEAYSNAQNEANRVDEGRYHIATQYNQTSEGKSALQNLRNQAPDSMKNLSDNDLMKQAIQNPKAFEVYSYNPLGSQTNNYRNPAIDFSNQMQKDILKQSKAGSNYDWGSLGTTEIYAGTKDKTLKPVYDMISQAIETGTGQNFSSLGLMGLNFKDNKGNDIPEGEAKKVSNMAVTKDLQGNPILKVGVS